MQLRSLLITCGVLTLAACGGGTEDRRAVPVEPATNSNGSPTTAIVTANFDPSTGVLPLPSDLLLSGSGDLTLNIPVADPTDISNPLNALNALDGWGTVAPWSATFSETLNPSSVVPGSTVRLFQVQRQLAGIAVTGLDRELTPGVDYVATLSGGSTIAIVPLRPLDQLTTYMAVITDGITDTAGNNATPSQVYFLTKRPNPLVDGNGQSTDPLLGNATAQALEPLRQLTNAQEAVAAAAGVDPEAIILSWSATTQGITPVLLTLRSLIQPLPSQLAPSGLDTSVIGGAGAADILIGVTTLPYYLDAPTAANPTAPLTTKWEAAPGAYPPPFDGFGLDPTSTNITFANPIPVTKSLQTVPMIISLPKTPMPAAGYPVTIFQHGITGNRSQSLALADTLAQIGRATIAIDQPLHGITPQSSAAAFYVENTPFGPIANERTFDLDLSNNETGAPGPDGVVDPSGTYTINLTSLLTSRDNSRQASADLMQLTANVSLMDIDGDGTPDFDTGEISFVGQSLGSMVGTSFLAAEPTVDTGVLAVPGGGIIGLLLGSPTFGPQILMGLQGVGLEPGTPDFSSFVVAAQTVIDSSDPLNWADTLIASGNRVLLQEVVGSATSPPDNVIPNAVEGFPLSGTEPLISAMGLTPITESTTNPAGIQGVTRFIVGSHGSLLDPSVSLEATLEMQTETATMIVSDGLNVTVANPAVLQGN